MFQTITKGLLHFEDLDPKMFEIMYQNILVTSGEYKSDIRPYGIKGSDDGVDILCTEKNTKLKHFIQCKRYQSLSLSELKGIVDRIVECYSNDYQGNVLTVVTSCDVRKEAYEGFEKYALSKGFSKALFYGQVYLDSILHLEKYERVKARFFNSEISKEERARKKRNDTKVGKQLVETKLLKTFSNFNRETIKRLQADPSWRFKESEIIVRSIYDEVYPGSNENDEPDTWFRSFLHDTWNDGIQLHLASWTYETIVINSIGQWMTKKEFDQITYDGETLELKVNIIGRIPFYNIVDIEEDGDNYYPYPHIFCIFTGEEGPFSEICYEYHDYETNKRIMFEKGQRAWICEHDFQQLKLKLQCQDKPEIE